MNELQTRETTWDFVALGTSDKISLSVSTVKRFFCEPTRTGAMPPDDQVVKFIGLCKARQLNPFEGDAYFLGYESKDGPRWSLITSHQAFLKRAELSPDYDGMQSGVIVSRNGQDVELEGDYYSEGDTITGAWAKVFLKSKKVPIFKRLRLATFRKSYGVWATNPEGMIVKCAEADALRTAFPNKCGGMYLRGEMPETTKEPNLDTMKRANATDFTGSNKGLPKPEQPAAQPPEPEQTPAPEAPTEATIQDQLAEFMSSHGVSFDGFVRYLTNYKAVKDPDSIGDWSQVPESVCKSLMHDSKAANQIVKEYKDK